MSTAPQTPAGQAVSNSAFLRELALGAGAGSALWTAAFVGNPDMAGGGWAGKPYNASAMATEVDGWGNQNTYFSVAALAPNADGELARRKANFARLLALVADDVEPADLMGNPSYVLNTSPGKWQVGIFLDAQDAQCADLALVTRLVTNMAERGLIKADKSGNNAVRFVRLPVGQNQKPRDSGPFACRLDRFDASARYSLADAAAIFGMDLDQLDVAPAGQGAGQAAQGGAAIGPGRPQDELVRTLTSNILAGKNLHDSLNMLAASLVASGMAGGAVVNMLRGLLEASAAPRDDRWQARLADIPRTVSTAQQKFAPAVTISLLRRGASEQASQAADLSEDDDGGPTAVAAAPADDVLLVPDYLQTVPGMLGRAVAWMNATARKPQPLLAVQAVLALGSAVMGRRYCTNNGNWPALYFLNVGLSGSGKEHAKFATERLLEAAGLGRLVGVGRFASEAGVVSSLIDKPAQFSVLDEFGKMLQSASVSQNFADRNTLKALMEVWSRTDGVLRPVAYSTAGLSGRQAEEMAQRCVRKPSLTLLAMSTPDTLFAGLTTSAVGDGFLNRFLTVHSDHGRQLARPVEDIDPSAELLEWLAQVHTQPTGGGNLAALDVAHDMEPAPVVVPLDAGALRVFAELEAAVHERMGELDAEGLAEMMTRTTEVAMRVALIVAISCGHEAVLKQDSQWATDYVLCHAERNLLQLRDKLSDGPFDQLCKDVLRLVKAASDRGVTERDLNRSSRPWREAQLRQRDDALRAIERRGEIVHATIPGSSGRGRQRTAWVSAAVARAFAAPESLLAIDGSAPATQ